MHRFCIYILDRKNSSLWCVVEHRIYKKIKKEEENIYKGVSHANLVETLPCEVCIYKM